jgi:hypothetical protein
MLSTELEYLCIELKCFLEGWNTIDRVGIPLYTAGIPMCRIEILYRVLECFRHGWLASAELEYLCTELECLLEGWNAFDRVGIPLYMLQMHSRGLACFRQSWNTFLQSWNAI